MMVCASSAGHAYLLMDRICNFACNEVKLDRSATFVDRAQREDALLLLRAEAVLVVNPGVRTSEQYVLDHIVPTTTLLKR